MKVGDIVKVTDGSWSRQIKNGHLTESFGIDLAKHSWKILMTGCKIPTNEPVLEHKTVNDTVLYSLEDNSIVFIQEEFLAPYHNFCPCCGKERA